jgi:hypothetical protein
MHGDFKTNFVVVYQYILDLGSYTCYFVTFRRHLITMISMKMFCECYILIFVTVTVLIEERKG